MKNLPSILITIILICLSLDGFGQNGLKLYKKKSERIPVQIINNLLVVSAEVNDFMVLNFIVDTGVRIPILLEPSLSLFFEDKYKRNITVRGLGPNDAMKAELIGNNSLKIGSLIAEQINLVVVPEPSFNISEYLGVHVHGIIGYDLFKQLVVEMDYSQKWMRFHQVEKFKAPKRFTKLPISIEGFKPYIVGNSHSETDSMEVKLLIDTGASYPLTLYPESDERIKAGTPHIDAYLGTGLSGDLFGKIARTTKMNFADFEFNEIITAFPDTTSVRHLEGEGRRNGSIGGEIMKRFRVIFNYQDQSLYLKTNSKYKEGFEYNKTGILLKAKGENLDVFIIEQIDENSAGERAKLQVGDELIQIQQHLTADLNLNQVYHIFSATKEGKTIRLVIKREGILMKLKLVLKSVI